MTLRHLIRFAAITVAAVFLMTASANATVIFNTTASAFSGGGLSLGEASGADATLSFQTQPGASVNPPPPSNANYGIFTLACATCTANNAGSPVGAFFSPFTFNLTITETVPNAASGTFVGTSTGGVVYLNQSTITINWAPLLLSGGSFGTTSFAIPSSTLIVNPTSGANDGQTTVQGTVSDNVIPEPATLGLIGGGLIGLGLLRRKRTSR